MPRTRRPPALGAARADDKEDGRAGHVREPVSKMLTHGNPREVAIRFREVRK